MRAACLLFVVLIGRAGAEDASAGGAVHIKESAPEPEVNPFTADGDATEECYNWAADGQCGVNPGYMLSSCKYSCWEWYNFRASKYPDAEIDKSYHCHSWAGRGECHKNVDFMKRTCPQSCKERGYDAPDEPPPPPPKKKKKKKKKVNLKDEV